VTQTAKRGRHRSAGKRSETDAGDPENLEAEVAFEESRHCRDSEAAYVLPAADMQRRWLTAGQQEQAVVQGGQVRDRHNEHASWPQHPAHLTHRRHDMLHRDELTIPNHQVEVTVGSGECCLLDIDPGEIGRGPDGSFALIFIVVDDWTFRLGKLIAEEHGLPSLPGMDLEKTALVRPERLDHAGDLGDDPGLNVLMSAFSDRVHDP
jgi:hypothetical protein